MQVKGSMSFSMDYEIGARKKPQKYFVLKHKGMYKLIRGKVIGYRNLFGIPWSHCIKDKSYFINTILYVTNIPRYQPDNNIYVHKIYISKNLKFQSLNKKHILLKQIFKKINEKKCITK